ncbi:hypothetical protein TanjilG_15280 [Lupinus angustifolius]|uniref:Transmembrane protein n=1 Tax=Lupinus angustifolius TaxID=3871 RepID=A0A1J7HYY0_LUPAN|nr:hypothetical protein TanjilG_15280 [Lupinus angustifolius]
MTGEEISGPPGPKMFRLFFFVGAGVFCTFAINKWRDYERKTIIQQQQQAKGIAEVQSSSDSVDIHKPLN